MKRTRKHGRREFLKLVAGAALALPRPLPAQRVAPRYNLLFLMADQHNPHVLGAAGNPQIQTPHLDRLARQGTRFDNAYCTYPICVPARQSILTGKYPHSNGAYSIRHILDDREYTIAEAFHRHGYRTAAIGKMHFLDEQARHGFDEHAEYGTQEGAAIMPEIRGDPDFAYDRKIYSEIPVNILRGAPAINGAEEAVASRARRFLRALKTQPFCLWVSFGLPHWHWVCAPEFYYMYDPKTLRLPASYADPLAGSPYARRLLERRGFDKLTEEQTRLCRARYYGAVSAMDHYVGQVLGELEAQGLAGRTLVVYTSDHGEMCGEHRLWDKTVFYEGSVRIPLLMRLPGVIPAGRVVEGLISHIDLFPSLVSLCGLPAAAPAPIDGRDLAPQIRGAASWDREILFSEMNLDEEGAPGAVMARWKQWSYFHYKNDLAELYNLEEDLDQMRNVAVAEASAPVVRRLQDQITDWVGTRKRPQWPLRLAPETHPLTRSRSF